MSEDQRATVIGEEEFERLMKIAVAAVVAIRIRSSVDVDLWSLKLASDVAETND